MNQPRSAEQPHESWGAGPWRWSRDAEPPRGARWFPVVFSVLVQSAIVIWLLASGRPASDLLAAGAALAGSFFLLLVRQWPGIGVALVAVLTLPAVLLTTIPLPIALPLAFAVIAATVRGARPWVWGVVGVSLAATVALGFTVDAPFAIVRPLAATLVLSLLVGVGETVRNRRERFAEYRAAASRRRQSEAERERVRIARELHDVLAHSLSSINVQAGVGLHLIDEQPERAAEALANIKQTSKLALEEVRGVLGFLRSTVDDSAAGLRTPQPELAEVRALIDSASKLGLRARLEGEVPGGLTQLAELAIYRIIQEAITNSSRHAEAQNVTVSFTADTRTLRVEITDDGVKHGETDLVEGRGLLGMRERAALLGGTLDAAWQPDGGFCVRLDVPLRGGVA